MSPSARQLQAERSKLQRATAEREWGGERQKLLIDLVCCQEELEHILKAQVALLEEAEGLPPDQAAHMSVAAMASGNNRCNSMLAGVTVQQLRQVHAMTAQQWVDAGTDMFTVCSAMLELANRQLEEAAGSDAAGSAPAGAEALAAAMHASAREALHELQWRGMPPLVLAAMFHNRQPYFHAASINWLTSKQDIAPRSHWRRVLQRLRLSVAQLLHLRVLHAEFGRLSAAAAREGESLAAATAALSIARIADKLQDGGWHAGVDGGSCKTKSAPPQPAAAAAAAGDTPDEGLSRQLQAYLERLNIHICVTGVCIVNLLTLRQLATLHVASFPFAPNPHALAEEAAAAAAEGGMAAADEAAAQQDEAAAGGGGDDDDSTPEPPPAAAAAAHADEAAARLERAWAAEVAAHMAQRQAVLAAQVDRWWQDHEAQAG